MKQVITIEKILFPKGGIKSESGYYLLRGISETGVSLVCKGTMGWCPGPQETLTLEGEYVTYKGEKQFKFNCAKITLPLDSRAQLNYVCERTKGLGEKMADQIWDALGENWQNLQNGQIKKISNATFENFVEQIGVFKSNKEQAEIVAWLESKGATTAMANAAYEQWKLDTAGVVNSDCYRLADLSGFSFKSVDERVRRNFGIGDDDPRRIKSAVLYAAAQEMSDGSTVLNGFVHLSKVSNLLPEVAQDMIYDVIKEMITDGAIHIFPKQGMGAMNADYRAELAIYQYVSGAVNGVEPEPLSKEIVIDEVKASVKTLTPIEDLAPLLEGLPFRPDATQLDAVRFAVNHRFAIVNGGAGTGKTTIIRLICMALQRFRKELTVNLCAFAGKAAARLREATGFHATTIHLMLGSDGTIFKGGPLNNHVVIIDEASMVNAQLLAEIVKRTPAALIMVGDQAQLPPVGQGQPMHDLLSIFPEAVRTLTTCYRNTEAVFQAALQIRDGKVPPKFAESANEKWQFLTVQKPDEAEKIVIEWARDGWLDFEQDILLCPKNGEKDKETGGYPPCTVNGLNESILATVNPRPDNADIKFQIGDRIINTENNAEVQVWNGTTGTVIAIDQESNMFIKLDSPIIDQERTTDLNNPVYKDTVMLDKDMVKKLRHAYALTVHKSQGSQYRRVVIVCLARDSFSLDRAMVYTAVTRTKAECVVIGDLFAFGESINRVRAKNTVLQLLAENADANAALLAEAGR